MLVTLRDQRIKCDIYICSPSQGMDIHMAEGMDIHMAEGMDIHMAVAMNMDTVMAMDTLMAIHMDTPTWMVDITIHMIQVPKCLKHRL